MSSNKKAILLVDGLPPSSKANLFIKQLGDNYDVYYVSFATDLNEITPESISLLLERKIQMILKTYHKLNIIGVSFGGYVIMHSNNILSRYTDAIERITVYSPVAKISNVVGIETLPTYLNKRYPNLNIDMKGLLKLDQTLSPSKLSTGNLAKVTRVILGANDSQLPVDFHRYYFSRFKTSITNEGHISISSLLSRGHTEWM